MEYTPAEIPPGIVLIAAQLEVLDAERLLVTYRFAAAAHDGQLRDEGTAYISHPVAVTELLWQELGCRDLDLLLAALTHDILEDRPDIDPGTLGSLIGVDALTFVQDVSKPPARPEGVSRDRVYLERLPTLPRASRLLKLADRIDNVRSLRLTENRDKVERSLTETRAVFVPLALATDATAARLLIEACDALEAYLNARAD
jgi:GTP pyrophosphokinase